MFNSAVSYVHALLQHQLKDGNVVVDATLGNGLDAALMAKLIGSSGTIYGFDVQTLAIDVTNSRLKDYGGMKHFVVSGHESMNDHVQEAHKGNIAAITFNLGYLPGGDKTVTTHADTTIIAIKQAASLLAYQGMITIVCYKHAEGERELTAVRSEIQSWDQESWTCIETSFLNHKNNGPMVFVVVKNIL